jgi:IS5 family transposase
MRETRSAQPSIFQPTVKHEIAAELSGMSEWLDNHPQLLDLVRKDLMHGGTSERGRRGLTVDSVLRCAIVKQYRQVDYRSLAFYLRDSVSFIAFARLEPDQTPSKSTLQELISAISAETWEALNRTLLDDARQQDIEDGQRIRVDATVTDSPVLEPTDSKLLYDCVRVAVRLLKQARAMTDQHVAFRNRSRVAKRRAHAIFNAHTQARRLPLYKELLSVTVETLEALDRARNTLEKPVFMAKWREDVDHYRPLMARVVNQTRRRVLEGEKVPAGEKIFSLFEPHTDIIVKGSRSVQYGHKVTLTGGCSGLVLDVMIESGNPADTTCLASVIDRHIAHFGQAPRDLAADGGYASQGTLAAAKAAGIENVAFQKRAGLSVEAMTADRWLYRKLCNFRAGIEATISWLKRSFGLSRCSWKGLPHFKAYVHSAVFTHNLTVLTQRLTSSG